MFAEFIKHSSARPAHRLHVLEGHKLAHQAEPRCVICALPATSSFAAHSYRLYTCDNCDFVFLDPAVAKSVRCEALCDDAYFRSGGAGYSNYLADCDVAAGTRQSLRFTACGGWRAKGPRRWIGGGVHP